MITDRKKGILLSALSIIAICILSMQVTQLPHTNADTSLPPMTLTLVGADGNQTTINESDIAGFSTYRAFGGYKNQLGLLKGLGNYTGVPLGTLFNLVGGITNSCRVRITANDSYTQELTFAQMNGDFTTYDNVTGAEVPHNEPLVPIVAYYFNDTDLSPSDGPLKLAIVGPEGFATNSTFWVKQVIRIDVIDTQIPEFPETTFSLITLFTIVAVVSSLIIYKRRRIG